MKRFFTLLVVVFASTIGFLMIKNLIPSSDAKPVTIQGTTVPPIPELNAEKVIQGEVLYKQHCASCHGADLKGASNWKETQPDGSLTPPPHDGSGHTWHHSDEVLLQIISEGGDSTIFNTKMPGFGDQLTRSEIAAILDFIKSYWGEEEREYQWWITAVEYTYE